MGCRELDITSYFRFAGSGKPPESGFSLINETTYKGDFTYEPENAYTGVSGYSVIVSNDPINNLDLYGLWIYEFSTEGKDYGHIYAVPIKGDSLKKLAKVWNFGDDTPWEKIKLVEGDPPTLKNGIITNLTTQCKYDVFPIMPEFYQQYVGNPGKGNCGNAAFSYLGMYPSSVWGETSNPKEDFKLLKKLTSGESKYAGTLRLYNRGSTISAASLIHFAIDLADGYVFEKDAHRRIYELRKGSIFPGSYYVFHKK